MAQVVAPKPCDARRGEVVGREQRVYPKTGPGRSHHLGMQLRVPHVGELDPVGDDRPQPTGLGAAGRAAFFKHKVIDEVFGDLEPRERAVVVVAPLSDVEVKEQPPSGPGVKANVDVREAPVPHRLKEPGHLGQEFRVVLGEHQRVVADAERRVLFEQHVAKGRALDPAVLVRVAGEHAHAVVGSWDQLLDDERPAVAALPGRAGHAEQLVLVAHGVGLLLALPVVQEVVAAVGGLHDGRVVKGQGRQGAVEAAVDHGGRVVDAQGVAEPIETVLEHEPVEFLRVYVGGDRVRGQRVFAGGCETYVVVPAPQHKERLMGIGVCELAYLRQEHGPPLDGGHMVERDDSAFPTGAGGVLAEHMALHPVGLIEGACHAVGADVGAQQHGNERLIAKFQAHRTELPLPPATVSKRTV